MLSAIILVGGRATRAQGFPKYQFTIKDKTFLEKQIAEIKTCTDELLIGCRDTHQISEITKFPDIQYIHDIRKDQGPAGGIHAGAYHAKGDFIFVTACDMPYITCKVIRFLHAGAKDYDAAVPTWEDGKFEPLCAVYRRAAILSFFETSEEKKLSRLIEKLKTHYIPVEDIRKIDPDIDVFININDFESLKKMKDQA